MADCAGPDRRPPTNGHHVTAAIDNRKPLAAIGTLSAVALTFLVWLIYFKEGGGATGGFAYLPAVNATLNGLSAICLMLGLSAIRRRDRATHQRYMQGALALSTLFLVSYIVYHSTHGDTRFLGQGLVRPVYFFILISHIVLSAVALPMVLTTFYFSWTDQFVRHRKLARWTFPIWLYVSVTGVAIFFMLKIFNPPA